MPPIPDQAITPKDALGIAHQIAIEITDPSSASPLTSPCLEWLKEADADLGRTVSQAIDRQLAEMAADLIREIETAISLDLFLRASDDQGDLASRPPQNPNTNRQC